MLYTFPGHWYQTYLLHSGNKVAESGNDKLRHRVLTICLPCEPNMYCYDFFKSRYNPYWESTEFTLWFPEQLSFWSVGSWFPNVTKESEDGLRSKVGSGQFDEVVVLGRQTTRIAEAVIELAFRNKIEIGNFAVKGSQAHARVSALTKKHLRAV